MKQNAYTAPSERKGNTKHCRYSHCKIKLQIAIIQICILGETRFKQTEKRFTKSQSKNECTIPVGWS